LSTYKEGYFQKFTMGPKEIYLILYNLGACTGWFLVLALALQSLAKGIPEDGLLEALSNVYAAENLATLLTYAQTSALLEILHAGLGLVRSPLIVTAMQVGSRIVALVAINYSPDAQSKYIHVFKHILLTPFSKLLILT
jgi:hypothetical protein